MTVTLYHLCASMRACARACVLVFVEGASSIFPLRVCVWNDYTPFIYKQSPKSILLIYATGRGSSVGCL